LDLVKHRLPAQSLARDLLFVWTARRASLLERQRNYATDNDRKQRSAKDSHQEDGNDESARQRRAVLLEYIQRHLLKPPSNPRSHLPSSVPRRVI
jgi:hypothetical protein